MTSPREPSPQFIKTAEEKYQLFFTAFQNSPVIQGVIRFADGVLLEVNDKFLSTFGLNRADVIGKTTLDLGLWLSAQERTQLINELTRTGKVDNLIAHLTAADGRHFKMTLSAVLVEHNHELLMLGTMMDLTDYFDTRTQLSRSLEHLHLLQKAIGAGVWDLDIKTGTASWSPELFELFGLDPLTDKPGFEAWAKCVHPDDLESASKRVQQSISKGGLFNNEYRCILPNGEIRWINSIGQATFDETGKPIHLVGMSLDASDRKLQQEKTRRLILKVQEEAREEASKKLAQDLHDDLGQVLAAFNYEIQALKRKLPPSALFDEATSHFAMLNQRSIELVRSIACQLRPPALNFGLLPGIHWLLEEMKFNQDCAIELETSGLEQSISEPQQIIAFRIIQESLANIRKHATSATKVEVSLSQDGNSLLISIRDNGQGFNVHQVQRQMDSMGLRSMIDRAESLGGHLSIGSAPGQGTVIDCRLPITDTAGA